jgi:hypothetical protein
MQACRSWVGGLTCWVLFDDCSSPEEASFFKLLQKELRKSSEFFVSLETQFGIRLSHVRQGMKMIDTDTGLARNEDSWRQMVRWLSIGGACMRRWGPWPERRS